MTFDKQSSGRRTIVESKSSRGCNRRITQFRVDKLFVTTEQRCARSVRETFYDVNYTREAVVPVLPRHINWNGVDGHRFWHIKTADGNSEGADWLRQPSELHWHIVPMPVQSTVPEFDDSCAPRYRIVLLGVALARFSVATEVKRFRLWAANFHVHTVRCKFVVTDISNLVNTRCCIYGWKTSQRTLCPWLFKSCQALITD